MKEEVGNRIEVCSQSIGKERTPFWSFLLLLQRIEAMAND